MIPRDLADSVMYFLKEIDPEDKKPDESEQIRRWFLNMAEAVRERGDRPNGVLNPRHLCSLLAPYLVEQF